MVSKVLSSVVLSALLCVWFATAIPYPEEETRFDALQEDYEKVTLDIGVGDARSTVFGDCLATARTIDAKLSSIAIEGSEYVRYVPDADTLAAVSPVFVPLSGGLTASTIAECAAAAKAAAPAVKMFRYNGGDDCSLSGGQYDLTVAPACDDTTTQQAVFVLNE